MSDITWTGEQGAEWASHYVGRVADPFPPARSKLIAEAMDKPVQGFRQWDAWVPVARYAGDCVTGTQDGETPVVTWSGDKTWELRNGTPVRVQIADDVDRQAAIEGLRAILAVLELDGELAEAAPPRVPMIGPYSGA